MKLDITAKGEYGVAYFENTSIRTTTIGNTIYYNYTDLLNNFNLANTKTLLSRLGDECKVIKMLNNKGNPAPMRAVSVKGLQKIWAYAASGEGQPRKARIEEESDENNEASITEVTNEVSTRASENMATTDDPVVTPSAPTEQEDEVIHEQEEEPVAEEATTLPEESVQAEEMTPSEETTALLEESAQQQEETVQLPEESIQVHTDGDTLSGAATTTTTTTQKDKNPTDTYNVCAETPDANNTEGELASTTPHQDAEPTSVEPIVETHEDTKAEDNHPDYTQQTSSPTKEEPDFDGAGYVPLQEPIEQQQCKEAQAEKPHRNLGICVAPLSENQEPHKKEQYMEPDKDMEVDALPLTINIHKDTASRLQQFIESDEEEITEEELSVEEPKSPEDVFKWIALMDTAIVGGSQVRLVLRQAKRTGIWMVFANNEWWIPARSICTVLASFHNNKKLHDELVYMCGEEKPSTYLPLSIQIIQKKSSTARLRLMVYKGLWWVSVRDVRFWLDKYPDYPLLEELKAELMDWTSLPYRNQAVIDMLRQTCETYLAQHEEGSGESIYAHFLKGLNKSREILAQYGLSGSKSR